MKRKGKEADQTYKLFDEFVEKVIIGGKSFLTSEGETLSSNAIEDCYKKYVDNAIEGSEQSYDDKIEQQFDEEKDQQALLVLAHAIWLWAFGVRDKKVETKKGYTKEIIGNNFSLVEQDLYPKGVGSAGQWHSQNKYAEIKFTFLLIRHLREQLDNEELSKADIRKRIEDICLYQKYEKEVESSERLLDLKKDLPKQSLAIANILLHFANPDFYEPIASDGHKKRITKFFSGLLTNEIQEDSPMNLDQRIKKIREVISEYDSEDFTFYDKKLKKVWNYSAIEKDFDEIEGLEYKKAIILYGPPGTSKTYSAFQVAESLITKHYLKDEKNVRHFFESDGEDYLKERITKLQLHPSYTYEDFVAGIRLEDNETKPVQGRLFEICKNAIEDQEKLPHVLILDEINRVDLSQLFGEVFSLLENRGISIPVAVGEGEDFKLKIPENLYVIGTMNEIDFSLERIDFALRRRFLWYPYPFNKATLKEILQAKFDKKTNPDNLKRFVDNAEALNEELIQVPTLGKRYQIGHTFFAEIADIYEKFIEINNKSYLRDKFYRKDGPAKILWDYSIEPMIRSFFGSMSEEDVEGHLKKMRNVFFQ